MSLPQPETSIMLDDDMKKKHAAPEEPPKKVGRPPKSEFGAAKAVTIKIAPNLREEFSEMAIRLGVQQADILEWGMEVGRKKLKAKDASDSRSNSRSAKRVS